MSDIGTLVSFTTGANVVADLNSNFSDVRTAFNTYAVQTDKSGTITVTHTFSAAQTFNGVITVTTTTTPQAVVRYDASNHLGISVSSAGAVTYNATGSSAGHTFSDAVAFSAGVASDIKINAATYSVICSNAALATSAIAGFLYVTTCAGTPTGAAATQTGTSPVCFDTTNKVPYWYDGSTWVPMGTSAGLVAGAKLGYLTGAGGTVTQGAGRTTGVTLSKLTGQITTDTASLAAEASAVFVVTNTLVAATDTVVITQASGADGGNTAVNVVATAAGSFSIRVSNNNASGGTAETGAIVINFTILKGVSS